MVYICSNCKKGYHSKCQDEWSCDCKCNVGNGADVTQKAAAIGGGAALAVGGIFVTVCTGGLGAVLLGGAMLGAGISSTWNGTEKAIKGERIDGKSYAADVAFGAVAGVATGGIGAAGETVAANVVKQGAKEVAKAGVKKLAVRTATGAVAGVVSKTIDEVKQCSTTDKEWSDFGKNFDENGKEKGTAVSWVTSAAVGGFGGAGSHVSSNLTKSIPSGVTRSVTRVAVSGSTAAVGDATVQGINIATGNQGEYDVGRTVKSAASSAIMTAGQEAIKNGVYRVNGGKNNLLHEESNKKLIEEKVPEEARKEVMDGYKNLKKIPQDTLNRESATASAYTNYKKGEESITKNYDSRIQSQIDLRDAALGKKAIESVRQHQQQIDSLVTEKKVAIKDFRTNNPPVRKTDIGYMNQEKAHFLTGDKIGQVAVDVKTPNDPSRGASRATFDYDANDQGRFKFSGHTSGHDYTRLPNHGKGDYTGTYTKNEDLLKTTNNVNRFTGNQVVQNEQQKKKKREKKD